jgi:hypothetical protein
VLVIRWAVLNLANRVALWGNPFLFLLTLLVIWGLWVATAVVIAVWVMVWGLWGTWAAILNNSNGKVNRLNNLSNHPRDRRLLLLNRLLNKEWGHNKVSNGNLNKEWGHNKVGDITVGDRDNRVGDTDNRVGDKDKDRGNKVWRLYRLINNLKYLPHNLLLNKELDVFNGYIHPLWTDQLCTS